MTKQIQYKLKQTSANTQYVETTSSDTKWILQQCRHLIQVAMACEVNNITEGQRLFTRNGYMPRMSNGKMNTCRTMCEGIIDNFAEGQYDLTEKQMIGLTEAFKVGNDIIENFDSIEFKQVDELPKLRIREVPEVSRPPSTFSTLFDIDPNIDSITVTYKKR